MVKRKVGGAQRYKRLAKAVAFGGGAPFEGEGEPGAQQQPQQPAQHDGPKPAPHLQRKITRKVQFYERVAQASAAKALRSGSRGGVRKRKAGSALPDLRSLAGELQALAAGQAGAAGSKAAAARAQRGTGSSIKRSKARLAVGLKETKRLQQVLAHPAYQADPIAAITQHLNNTLPTPALKPPAPARAGGKARRKQRAGVAAAMQS